MTVMHKSKCHYEHCEGWGDCVCDPDWPGHDSACPVPDEIEAAKLANQTSSKEESNVTDEETIKSWRMWDVTLRDGKTTTVEAVEVFPLASGVLQFQDEDGNVIAGFAPGAWTSFEDQYEGEDA